MTDHKPLSEGEMKRLLKRMDDVDHLLCEPECEGRCADCPQLVMHAAAEALRATPKPLDGEAESSRIVELFGERYGGPRENLSGGQLSDLQVAHQTALLGRNDIAFEGVLATAKDRIRWLSRQLEIVLARSTQKEATEDARDAARYRYLRDRDLDTIKNGGVFAGQTPENFILNGDDLDTAIDAAKAGLRIVKDGAA